MNNEKDVQEFNDYVEKRKVEIKMNKIYKIRFRNQVQKTEGGRIERHTSIHCTLPKQAVEDMGITEEDNAVSLSYDEDAKEITIKKI